MIIIILRLQSVPASVSMVGLEMTCPPTPRLGRDLRNGPTCILRLLPQDLTMVLLLLMFPTPGIVETMLSLVF